MTRYHSAMVLPPLLLWTQWHFYCLESGFGIVLLTAISHQVALCNTERLGLCLDKSVSHLAPKTLHLCCCLDSLGLGILLRVTGLAF